MAPPDEPRSSRPCAPSRTPSCTAPSSTSAWSAAIAVDGGDGRRPRRPHRRRLPAAQRDPEPGHRRGRRPRRASTAVDLDFTVMTDEERAALRAQAPRRPRRPPPAASQAHGHAEGRAIPFADPAQHDPRAADRLGQGRRRQVVGHRPTSPSRSPSAASTVAVVDADVWGFSIPRMLGVDRAAGRHRRDARPARGLRRALHLDGLLRRRRTRRSSGGARCCTRRSSSSSPTCTGTSPTTSSSTCRRAPATSRSRSPSSCPGPRSSSSPRRSRPRRRWPQRAAPWPQKVNLEVKGVIENMSWFTGDDGKRYELFGAGGGAGARRRASSVPLLGQVPLVPALREGGDDGRPIVAVDPDERGGRGRSRPSPRRSTSSWPPGGSTTPSYASAEPSEASAKSSSRSYGVCSPSTGTSKNPEPW